MPSQVLAMNNPEMVIALLVSGGYVTQAEVDAAECAADDLTERLMTRPIVGTGGQFTPIE